MLNSYYNRKHVLEQKHQRHFPDLAQAEAEDQRNPKGVKSPYADVEYRREKREAANASNL